MFARVLHPTRLDDARDDDDTDYRISIQSDSGEPVLQSAFLSGLFGSLANREYPLEIRAKAFLKRILKHANNVPKLNRPLNEQAS